MLASLLSFVIDSISFSFCGCVNIEDLQTKRASRDIYLCFAGELVRVFSSSFVSSPIALEIDH